VVLAVRPPDADALATLSWKSLPTAAGPDGTATLAAGDHLVLALPDPGANRATSSALQSILAASSGKPVDKAAVAAAASQLATLTAIGPADQPATTSDALTELAGGQGGFTAVSVVESDLIAFNAAAGAGARLTAVYPDGATAGDQVFAVPLTAGWIDPTLTDAASVFLAYLRGPGGDQAFATSGLRVRRPGAPSAGAPSAAATPGVDPSRSVRTLPDGGSGVAAALAAAIN